MTGRAFPYIIFTLAAITIFLVMTASHGLGLTTDSGDYYYSAMSFAHDRIILRPGERPFVQWPPLYPVVLSILHQFNALSPEGIRVFHGIIYGATIAITGLIIKQTITTAWIRWWSMLTITLMTPIMLCFLFLWSEALFIFFSVLLLYLLEHYSRHPSATKYIAILSTLTLCVLQRYNGVFYIPAVAFIIFYYSPWQAKKQRTIFSCLLPALAIGLWFLRNYLNYNTFTGEKQFRTLHWKGVTDIADILTAWVLPNEIPLPIRVLLVLLVLSAGVYFLKKHRIKYNELPLKTGIFFIVYITGTIILLLTYRLGIYMDHRYFAPALIPGILATAKITDQLYPHFFSSHKKYIVLLFGIWLLYPTLRTAKQFNRWQDQGIGYASEKWQQNSLVKWYDQNASDNLIYSNKLTPLLFGTDKPFHYYRQLRKAEEDHKKIKPGATFILFGQMNDQAPGNWSGIIRATSGSIWKIKQIEQTE